MSTDNQGGGLGSLASLANNLSIPLNLPGGAKSDLILNFLQSRNLQQRMIEKYNLLPRLYEDVWDARQRKWLVSETERHALMVKALQARTLDKSYTVTQDTKTDLITISWEDKEPAFSAEMLKGIIIELSHYLNNEYESDAMRERRFVEKRLSQTASDLDRWERQVPTAELTLADIQRERLAALAVYTEMRKQLELAKIAEAKELVQFKVLDPPLVPENKYKPMRLLICAATLAASAALAIFWVFVYHAVRNARQKRGQGLS